MLCIGTCYVFLGSADWNFFWKNFNWNLRIGMSSICYRILVLELVELLQERFGNFEFGMHFQNVPKSFCGNLPLKFGTVASIPFTLVGLSISRSF